MIKPDYEKLHALLIAEYTDYPNPDNDGVIAFEAKGAKIIADLAIFTMKEAYSGMPTPVLIQAICGVCSIALGNAISNSFTPDQYNEVVIYVANVMANQTIQTLNSDGIKVDHVDVGDA